MTKLRLKSTRPVFKTWCTTRLNSGNFGNFDFIEPIINLNSSTCRAEKIILNDTKISTIPWGTDSLGIQPMHTSQSISSIEEFRLKFCRESVTLRWFELCLFPRHDFKWNPWLLVLFTMILAKKQSCTVLDLICTSQ